ncbi:MAG: lamin tail domain-containing protein [Bacteroidota bacterium]
MRALSLLLAALALVALALVALAVPAFAQAGERGAALLINEIRIDQPSADDDEYVEFVNLTGAPFSLDGYTYLVIGDGAGGSGVVESVTRFGASDIVPANGFFLVAEDGDTFGAIADITTASLNFENSDNVTHLLVNGFTGADQDDLDLNDDGTLDLTPWMFVQDAVALIETVGSGDQVYATALGGTDVGPNGSFVPSHVYRDAATLAWVIGEFDPSASNDTPGATNTPPSSDTRVFFGAATGAADEGDGTVTLTVSIAGPDATVATTADVALTSGDPLDLDRYMTQSVAFPAGDGSDQTVTVTITDDMDIEGTEAFTFTLQNVAGGNMAAAGSRDTFTLTLTDNDNATGSFDVVINEILIDPNTGDTTDGIGDFDTDGDGDAETEDEFVELYNNGSSAVDISSWELYDGSGFRHTFTAGTVLNPGDFIVVVGRWDNGSPPAGVVNASDGMLSLNNGGDSVFLYKPSTGEYVVARYNGDTSSFPGPVATLIGETNFGSDTDGESLQRAPDGSATIVSSPPNPGALNIPVELTAFSVTLDGIAARLAWTTSSETNNRGFEVQMRGPQDAAFDVLGFVEGRGTTTETTAYGFRTDALAAGSYTFRLKQLDFDGAFEYSPEVEATVTLDDAFTLSDTYPNPFSGVAELSLRVQQPQAVLVTVYDALGRTVATLHDGPMTPEVPAAIALDGRSLASGLYVIRVVGETFATTRRVTLVR